tara:strand:- start:2568 stop:4067 length:1500 start_codon:yes stop_codon:yes gene_type:complete
MQHNFTNNITSNEDKGSVIFGVNDDLKMVSFLKKYDSLSKNSFEKLMGKLSFSGQLGSIIRLYDFEKFGFESVYLIGTGSESEYNEKTFIKIANHIETLARKENINHICIDIDSLKPKKSSYDFIIRQLSIKLNSLNYLYSETKNIKSTDKVNLKKSTFLISGQKVSSPECERSYKQGLAIANGITLARKLGDLPSNICTPSYLAKTANSLVRTNAKVKVQVHNETQMRSMGMNCLLSVSKGSKEPAKLITIKYNNGPKNQKPIILVGKGITFDTGGISIKPSNAMDEMKYDMCGAASVIGTIRAISELKTKINVIGIIAASENMPGSQATKPGDVVKTMSGQTVEILNTDAEGRLVLCDALTYANKFKPEIVIDIATLTGAVLVALGKVASGLLSNDEFLSNEIIRCSKISHDYAWPLPMWDDYQSELDSNFADIANIGKRYAGTITAACFLSRFAKDYKWAHLDIAGTAWNEGQRKGGTGRPVSLLTHFLLNRAKTL